MPAPVAPSPIATPPDAPLRSAPTTFAAKREAWLLWEEADLFPGLNTATAYVDDGVAWVDLQVIAVAASASTATGAASAASTSAGNALTSANNASASAAAAAGSASTAAGFTATSASSLAIGTGAKVFAVGTGKSFQAGEYILAADQADPANYMHGLVTGYSGANLTVNVTSTGGSGTKTAWNVALSGPAGPTGATGAAPGLSPGGRLTLTSATPVLTSDVSNAGTVYYSPYTHQFCPLYNGAAFAASDLGGELSCLLSDTTKSPAAAANGSNYDLFVWDDAGTYRLSRGPAWSSDTARGTGAGTTELERLNGVLVNKVAITNGPVARRGTYVGTMRCNGSGATVSMTYGSTGGASPASFGLWNAYNRVEAAFFTAHAGSWTYATSFTWRAANSNTSVRMSMVVGLNEDAVDATYQSAIYNTVNTFGLVGIGLDSASAPAARATAAMATVPANGVAAPASHFAGLMGLGWHYLQPLENSNGSTNYYVGVGNAGQSTDNLQTGFSGTVRH